MENKKVFAFDLGKVLFDFDYNIALEKIKDKIGLPMEEVIKELFDNDFGKHVAEASKIPEFDIVDPVRKAALIDLTYNMGAGGFMGFKNTRKNLREGDYDSAADELLDSAYALQVKGRAKEVAEVCYEILK